MSAKFGIASFGLLSVISFFVTIPTSESAYLPYYHRWTKDLVPRPRDDEIYVEEVVPETEWDSEEQMLDNILIDYMTPPRKQCKGDVCVLKQVVRMTICGTSATEKCLPLTSDDFVCTSTPVISGQGYAQQRCRLTNAIDRVDSDIEDQVDHCYLHRRYHPSRTSPSRYRSGRQYNYVTTPIQRWSTGAIRQVSAYRGRVLPPQWNTATNLPYNAPQYNPWNSIPARPRYAPAPPPKTKYSESSSSKFRSTCLPSMHPALELVLQKAIAKENEDLGNYKREIVKSISQSEIKKCKKCVAKKCEYLKSVEMAMTIAPACLKKSKSCVCGVNRSYPKRMCTVSAKVDAENVVRELQVFCERRMPLSKLKAWRRKQRKTAKHRKRMKAKRAKLKKQKKRKMKSKKKRRRRPKASKAKVTKEVSEESGFSAEGPELQHAAAPIVEWDEATSQATVRFPEILLGNLVAPVSNIFAAIASRLPFTNPFHCRATRKHYTDGR